MVTLHRPKDFQAVRALPFCYLCGQLFTDDDEISGDHVPPKNAFNPRDKEPPLKLRTHKACNEKHSVDDNKIGLLVSLRHGKKPKSPKNRALNFVHYPHLNVTAVDNLNVDDSVWRWIAGFHAALYHQPLPSNNLRAIETPFPRADRHDGNVQLRPLRQQHLVIVENIKRNRAHNNLDRIVSNNRKLTYECVWCQFDNDTRWLCMFALDIYDWKDLGSHTREIPARGCAGIYMLPDASAPGNAARDHRRGFLIPNYDVFDPFAP